MRLLILFVVVPLVELLLLIQLSGLITWPYTILIAIVTGIIGTSLARRQGFNTLRRIQAELNDGGMPTTSVVDAFMIFAAGLLLMTPGILTDVLGFSLLVPACRSLYRHWTVAWLKANFQVRTFTSTSGWSVQGSSRSGSPDDDVIDSYVVNESDAEDPKLPPS
ncbi:MAG: FxsA family protein [Pirellulaceae bacterium]